MNIVLIGMPGAARKTFRRFIDTDRLIKKKYGDIPTLFLTEGEEKFREYEREAVREAALHKRAVISTGGGVILSEENMRLLKKDAFVVFLDATVRTLAGRIAIGSADRRAGDRGDRRALRKKETALSEIRRFRDGRERLRRGGKSGNDPCRMAGIYRYARGNAGVWRRDLRGKTGG